MKKRKIVFGLGPGRCGSASLALLLNSQKNALVSHELFPIIPWNTADPYNAQFRWEQFHHQTHLFDLVGDVAMYYLPWVEFFMSSLTQLPHLINGFDFKFIVMHRDIEEIVQSFLVKFKRQNNNPLQNHNDPSITVNEWDACFPKHDDMPLEEAIRMYCSDYYKVSEELQKKYPDNVKIFDVESLNSKEGVMSILAFVGIENPVAITGIKRNES